MAVAHEILVAAFADLGADDLDHVDKHRPAMRPVRRLGTLGYNVMPRPKTAAA